MLILNTSVFLMQQDIYVLLMQLKNKHHKVNSKTELWRREPSACGNSLMNIKGKQIGWCLQKWRPGGQRKGEKFRGWNLTAGTMWERKVDGPQRTGIVRFFFLSETENKRSHWFVRRRSFLFWKDRICNTDIQVNTASFLERHNT